MDSHLLIIGIFLITLFISWYYFYIYYSQRSKKFIQSFLDSNTSITIFCNQNQEIAMNQLALEFFGFKSLEAFHEVHSTVSILFIKERTYIDKYTYGKNWVEQVWREPKRSKGIKVKMKSQKDALMYSFHIRISKMSYSNEYLLSFNDITEIEQEKDKIQTVAELDPLTQIYNRTKLNELFKLTFFSVNKYNRNFSLILFDIDHFKSVNDTYGHNVGDKVLVELARLVKGMLREKDIFARWGGEEFIILLEDGTINQAKVLANRLRKEIENYHFDVIKHKTCSFGVTEFVNGDTQTLILDRVDEALYFAKEHGRNQVVSR